jgi:hypothetical protein
MSRQVVPLPPDAHVYEHAYDTYVSAGYTPYSSARQLSMCWHSASQRQHSSSALLQPLAASTPWLSAPTYPTHHHHLARDTTHWLSHTGYSPCLSAQELVGSRALALRGVPHCVQHTRWGICLTGHRPTLLLEMEKFSLK